MRSKTIFLAVTMMFSAHAFAGGAATGGASEVTQVMNNFELISSVGKQSQMVAGQLKDYSMQTQQYMSMVQNLKNLAPNQIQQALAPYQQTLSTINQVYDATMGVYQTSTQAQQVYERRVSEMNRLKMDPQQYLMNEIALAKSKGGNYKTRMDKDYTALQNAQEKSQKLAGMQTQVSSISGNVEGLQVLAQQNQMMAGELLELNTTLRQERIDRLNEKMEKENASAAYKADVDTKREAINAGLREKTSKTLTDGSVNIEAAREARFKDAK